MGETDEFVPPVFIKYFDQEFENEEERIKAIKEMAKAACAGPQQKSEHYNVHKKDGKRVKKRWRTKIADEVKEVVFKRDKKRCCSCGCKKNVHIHHKVHVEHGGTNDADNLQLLCDLCHAEEHRGEPVYSLMIKSFWDYESA